VERDGIDLNATVSACPIGCWLVLGEGHNDAWTGFVVDDGRPTGLGASRQVDGGFNGWWLPPSDEERSVLMVWPPQNRLETALAITGVAILGCVGIAIGGGRRRRAARVVDDLGQDSVGVSGPRGVTAFRAVGRRESIVAAAVLVGTAGLVIAPLWAAIALVPAAIVILLRRPLLLGLAGVVLTAVLASIVTSRELSDRYFLNAGWPGHFEDLHRTGLFVVVLVLAACIGMRGDATDTVTLGDATDADDAAAQDDEGDR
jgi:arabinofuranan 3-O-arabinosyltransferase